VSCIAHKVETHPASAAQKQPVGEFKRLSRHVSPTRVKPAVQFPHVRPEAELLAGGGRSVQPLEYAEHGKSVHASICLHTRSDEAVGVTTVA